MKPQKKQELVIFELVNAGQSMYEDPAGKRKTSERPYGIPAVAMSVYTDDNGNSRLRKIRYARTENSPFVDEQDIDPSTRITKVVSKPTFTNGVLTVKPSQQNLLAFLRYHPYNESNRHWDLEGQKIVFRERNFEKIARDANDNTKKILEAGRLVYESNFMTDILPVARYLRLDTNADKDIILFQVKQYAEANPDDFIKLLGSAVVSRFSAIQEAESIGVIRVETTRVLWADGRQILQIPHNYDPYEYFAEVCFDTEYRSTWLEIKRKMSQLGSPDNDDVKIEEAKSDQTEMLNEVETPELVELLKEQGVIKYDLGKGFFDGDELLAKSKDELYKVIEKDKRVWATRAFN